MSNYYDPNPPRSNNTATIVLVVVLSILALVVLVCGGLGLAGYMIVQRAQQEFGTVWDFDAMDEGTSQSLVSEGRYQEAISILDETLLVDPENADLLNSKAWILATCPDASLRDGQQAVSLANQACELTEYKIAAYVDTLAAAHAELGEFDEAAEWQEKALDVNTVPAFVEGMRQRLLMYRAETPYREGPDGELFLAPEDAWPSDDAGNAANTSEVD